MQPARPANRKSMLFLNLAGLGAFLLLTLVGAWLAWSRYSHSQDWTPVEAEVFWAGILCEIERKNQKNWDFEAVVQCDEADAYIAERESLLSATRRKREVPYVHIEYEAAGKRTKVLRMGDVSRVGVDVGDKVAIFVDPANPEATDRPFGSGDIQRFAIMAAFGAAIWAMIVGLGWIVLRLNARIAARKQAGA
jgi:hypothetical protein